MKICFLDIDGVLKTTDEQNLENWHNPGQFNQDACRSLSIIIRATGCKIVISSSWRRYHGPKEMEEFLHQNGVLEAKVIGDTDSGLPIRGLEVDRWVRCHRPERYVIIDDYSLSEWLASQTEHLVITDPDRGLSDLDAMLAIAILNGEQA